MSSTKLAARAPSATVVRRRAHSSVPGAAVALTGCVLAVAHCGSGGPSSGFDPGPDAGDDQGADGGGGGSRGDTGAGTVTGGGFTDPNYDAGVVVDNGPTGAVTIDGCKGVASAAALRKGGVVDGAMKWLYPYDKTVFPVGITPPVLQWSPQAGGTDAVYVHLHSKLFDYQGCFPASTDNQLPLAASVWSQAYEKSTVATSTDPLVVELTTLHGGVVSGPIRQTWTLALGSLKGSVYYNTYNSALTGAQNGAVMKLEAASGTTKPLIAIQGTTPVGPCISCHSLSADGSTLVAAKHAYPNASFGFVDSRSYNLKANAAPDPNTGTSAVVTSADWGFAAVYPDGSLLLTNGSPVDSNSLGGTGLFSWVDGDDGAMKGPADSQMWNPQNGQLVPFSGLPANVKHTSMPMFSPDGKNVVWNDYDNGHGGTLAVASFDASSKTFSKYRVIYTAPAGAFPGWPFFTPDARTVIFVQGNSPKYASIENPLGANVMTGDLYAVDVGTGKSHALDLANGFASGVTYLPYPNRDEHTNFYPTGSPVSAGGYFWVFFTGRRN